MIKNIILLGDSFTQGAGVDYKDTFAGIHNKLNKKIINLSAVSFFQFIFKTKFIENYNEVFRSICIYRYIRSV